MTTKISIKKLTLCALFAALTAVMSQLLIPIGPIPINLAMLSVFVAGGLLGSSAAALSQTVYVLMGAVGLPVFAMLTGGIGIVLGPTGGYIIGYIAAAWLIGLIVTKTSRTFFNLVLAMITGLVLCYTLGTAWFMVVTKNALIESLMMCVVPFLIGDALKIAAAAFLVKRLQRFV
ncbi:biotin transport system substrate-specific component [Hydrogenoanaerobacterium saccharovorans]|uniref:Biotin transporter n=1 Tax=Hydrogenoanaerobacterium saccharovorans TaxID=474960 RepID=A0A1H7YQP4_9FIRM|nr:biotin transporter BioY [Hydrogenoanaerobacterium saccharovorans]RPF49080.1 biotin transport system substrate-specific component [Hydrogenoanaerobacterium saccharovorans]SEM48283.1 biotin transport system substrate-specific component [Hydrogenoanaerobacterium saccharovorans]